jgi:hypothetical protein
MDRDFVLALAGWWVNSLGSECGRTSNLPRLTPQFEDGKLVAF